MQQISVSNENGLTNPLNVKFDLSSRECPLCFEQLDVKL